MDLFDPPSIVRTVSDPEMEQYAKEATSALEASATSANTTLENYRDAGEALAKAKAKCKFGQWLPWLARHKIDRFQASRAIRIYQNWSKCASDAHLKDTLRMLAEAEQEEEISDPATAAPLILCRHCRIWKPPKKNCKDWVVSPERC